MTARHGCRIVLEGTIDEHAGLKKQLEGLGGHVILDLDKVTRITSFGVLEWRAALKELESASSYAFIRCRPSIVTQFNLVEGFGERGELVSLYLPYHCTACSHEFALLVDLRHHYFVAVSREPPYAQCRQCGADASFDGLAEDYLSYVGSRPRPHVPPAAHQLIDGVIGDVVETLKVKKQVDASVTRLSFMGPLNGDARLRSAMEGAEGSLVIDLGDVTSIDPTGMERLAAALAQVSVAWCAYVRLPLGLLDSFAGHLRRTFDAEGVCSVVLSEQCPRCLTTTDFEVWARGLSEAAVESRCSSCRSQVRLHPAEATVRQLRELLVEPPRAIEQHLAGRMTAATPTEPPPIRVEASGIPMVGESRAFRDITDLLRKVAPTGASVLLRGETGTGKEMLARLLHSLSPRRDGPFVAINCAALPENLIEAELFGHERGAFTGATQQAVGRFERASGGTLFIDEVGDIPLSVQVKLLRALQERSIERIGSGTAVPVDIRLVTATHRPLEEMMEAGEFREDLFFRISVVPVFVPPLRQRREDIWPIALHYLGEAQRRSGRSGIRFSERMCRALNEHGWPGNVRELINVIERAVALTPSHGTADLIDFAGQVAGRPVAMAAAATTAPPAARTTAPAVAPAHAFEEAQERGLKASVDEYEKKLIQGALVRARGNRTHAARELGISRQALVLKIAKYSL